jgi:hypothetical protein
MPQKQAAADALVHAQTSRSQCADPSSATVALEGTSYYVQTARLLLLSYRIVIVNDVCQYLSIVSIGHWYT